MQLKTNLMHYTCGITPKRVAGSGSFSAAERLTNTAGSKKTLQKWQAVDDSIGFDRPGNRTPDLPHRQRCL